MGNTIFSVAGCSRCKIVKQFMADRGIAFVEKDVKGDGKEDFQEFYKANRKLIYRTPDGITFPVFTDGISIYQGLGAIIAYLHSGKQLEGFFSVGTLRKEWINGIHVSLGQSEYSEEFIQVLGYLKNNNFKLEVETNGKNSVILQKVLDEGLADRAIMNVLGPRELYSELLGEEIDFGEIEESMKLTTQFPEYRFETVIAPITGNESDPSGTSYMAPEEIEKTAKMIVDATGSMKNPYVIKPFNPKDIPESELLKYRSRARRHQVYTEI
ncbi:pyruvate formate lyase activating enzyme [Desulfitispora alkaliphila]|uniref:hypothetical protein n=1 Tax=Desulfitispora alkaliphila TaxID=622674 RepID=UPI003D1B29D2